jgi:Lrp/AsnC family transcriptional regulator for asnA, asnC and gidA
MTDDIDRKIIAALEGDGRAPGNEIAAVLGVSEGTVRNRIRKLLDSGYLRVAAMTNPDLVPEKQLVLLGVKVAVSKDLIKTAEDISRLQAVRSAFITTGRYDIIVEAWVGVKHGLIEFLSGELATVKGIVSTESFVAMKSFSKWISNGP